MSSCQTSRDDTYVLKLFCCCKISKVPHTNEFDKKIVRLERKGKYWMERVKTKLLQREMKLKKIKDELKESEEEWNGMEGGQLIL